jgi:hypothetical protein
MLTQLELSEAKFEKMDKKMPKVGYLHWLLVSVTLLREYSYFATRIHCDIPRSGMINYYNMQTT